MSIAVPFRLGTWQVTWLTLNFFTSHRTISDRDRKGFYFFLLLSLYYFERKTDRESERRRRRRRKKDRGPLPSSRISARFLNYAAAAHISRLTQFIGTDSPPLLTVNKRVLDWMRSSTWRIMYWKVQTNENIIRRWVHGLMHPVRKSSFARSQLERSPERQIWKCSLQKIISRLFFFFFFGFISPRLSFFQKIYRRDRMIRRCYVCRGHTTLVMNRR